MMESIMGFHRMLKPVKFQSVEAGREKWQVLCAKVVEVTLTAWLLTTHRVMRSGATEIQGVHFYIKQLKHISPYSQILLLLLFSVFFQVLILNDLGHRKGSTLIWFFATPTAHWHTPLCLEIIPSSSERRPFILKTKSQPAKMFLNGQLPFDKPSKIGHTSLLEPD